MRPLTILLGLTRINHPISLSGALARAFGEEKNCRGHSILSYESAKNERISVSLIVVSPLESQYCSFNIGVSLRISYQKDFFYLRFFSLRIRYEKVSSSLKFFWLQIGYRKSLFQSQAFLASNRLLRKVPFYLALRQQWFC